MRSRFNLAIMAATTIFTLFAFVAVWPGWPKKYLPDFVDWPRRTFFWEHKAMRLGLDLQGGAYVLTEADLSSLPSDVSPDKALDGVKDIIERRVNAFGVSESEVTREGQNRLAVQIPGISPEKALQLIKPARLEFQEPVLNDQGQIKCLTPDGNEFFVSAQGVTEGTTDTGAKEAQCLGSAGETGTVVWTPALGKDSSGQTRRLTGAFIKPNGAKADVVPQPVVTIDFTSEGSLLFEQITSRLVGKPLGIFLDGDLIAAPTVQQAITGGNTIIRGLTLDEAKTLEKLLNSGAMPVPLRPIAQKEIEATLGDITLVRSVQAGMIGILAVMAFMILYYRLPGLLASLALVTYISTVMLLFKTIPVTITLAGIAGFVLSVGMAVDANVLVFERMKEELRAGRALAQAIEHGFDRAWSSIRDSNISTLITCGILWWFGDQFAATLVKGFALTLGIGVLVSMFSAIVVTRTLLRLLVGTPVARNLWVFAPDLRFGQAAKKITGGAIVFDFVKRRGFYFLLSGAVLVPGIISLLISPSLKAGIEFSSGATFTIQYEDTSVTASQVKQALADVGHGESRVQKTGDGEFLIRTAALQGAAGPPVGPPPPSERDQVVAGLEKLGALKVTNFNQVSEIVSKEIGRQATLAVGVAAIAILLYISWSFRNVPKSYRFGIAAVVAALHDALFILGSFSLFGKLFGTEINSMFITGLLTVVGFSVHDTIVVFDRIRENVSHYRGVPFDEVVNASLTETVARSINTSFTVLLTVIALLLMGAGSIDVLLLVLLLGIVSGTYSSIFIAAQILVAWEDGDLARLWRRFVPRRPVPLEAPQ